MYETAFIVLFYYISVSDELKAEPSERSDLKMTPRDSPSSSPQSKSKLRAALTVKHLVFLQVGVIRCTLVASGEAKET